MVATPSLIAGTLAAGISGVHEKGPEAHNISQAPAAQITTLRAEVAEEALLVQVARENGFTGVEVRVASNDKDIKYGVDERIDLNRGYTQNEIDVTEGRYETGEIYTSSKYPNTLFLYDGDNNLFYPQDPESAEHLMHVHKEAIEKGYKEFRAAAIAEDPEYYEEFADELPDDWTNMVTKFFEGDVAETRAIAETAPNFVVSLLLEDNSIPEHVRSNLIEKIDKNTQVTISNLLDKRKEAATKSIDETKKKKKKLKESTDELKEENDALEELISTISS